MAGRAAFSGRKGNVRRRGAACCALLELPAQLDWSAECQSCKWGLAIWRFTPNVRVAQTGRSMLCPYEFGGRTELAQREPHNPLKPGLQPAQLEEPHPERGGGERLVGLQGEHQSPCS